MNTFKLLAGCCFLSAMLAQNKLLAQPVIVKMAKDIKAGIAGSEPANLTSVNNLLFFTGDNGVNGNELWKYYPASGAASMVKDINNVGNATSYPSNFKAGGSTLYVRADDGTNGAEIWKSNGSSAGTVMIKNIAANDLSSGPKGLSYCNGRMFFNADDGIVGRELWKTDGTAAGTQLVKDLSVGIYIAVDYPQQLAAFDDVLYFSGRPSIANSFPSLFKTDGTEAGTVGVPIDCYSPDGWKPHSMKKIGNNLFLCNGYPPIGCPDVIVGNELLIKRTGGDKVELVKDINPGAEGSKPDSLTDIEGTCFFSAENATSGRELWKSDGTEAGTVIVKNIEAGAASSAPGLLTNVNGILFFTAQNTGTGRELWKSDGTTSGTVLVKDIVAGAGSSNPRNLLAMDGKLYFVAEDGINGAEI